MLRKLWRLVVRLFGLDACPVPPRRETPGQRARRKELARRLEGLRGLR